MEAELNARLLHHLQPHPLEHLRAPHQPGEHQPLDNWRFFTTGRPEDLSSAVRSLVGYEPEVESVTWDVAETRVVSYAE